ncbi:Flp family type IVb pilin [Neobacillus dielmonensis]|uniref:Flp family type IVb pilin n=1 Tax=Neobacillus dielmonensis TaxID=1347369 RepID=UPI0005AB7C51|nr:hypothetical protein [Neobacillus dielmonensis]
MLEKMKNLVVEEEGQALTEYGLIIGLIAIVVAGGLTLIAKELYDGSGTGSGLFKQIADKL